MGRQTPWAIEWVCVADSDVDPCTRTDGQFRSESDEGLCGSPERINMDRRQIWTGDRWTEDEFTDGKFTDEQTWEVVEPRGVEPLTFSLRTRRSTN